jgi:EmrB/QacA subfamily drug resistance transporter
MSSDPGAPAQSSPVAAERPHRWLGLAAICGATFMLLVDVTIVQVALPTIQRDFHASFTDLQWVISAYALTLSALILTSGSLSDRFGRKRIFLGGVALFTAASALCGLATGPLFLNLARALQGIGGAAMFATSLALIGQEFHGVERAKAIGVWGATVGGAVAVGPLVGGAITSGIGWRWIFFVNVPIGLATVAAAARLLVNVGDPESKSVDVAGLLTFSGSLFLLNFGLLRGSAEGWGSPLILGCLVGFAVLLGAFVGVELAQRRPMFDLSLFRNAGFCGVSIGTFAIGMGMFALFPYLTLYIQNDLGFSPFAGGVRLLPATLLTFLVPLVTRRTTERVPAGIVLGTGLVICAGGLAAMVAVTASSQWTVLLPGLVLTGIGIGIANPSIAKIGLGVVHPSRAGMASGISNTMRISGLATGIAALGAAFQAKVSSEMGRLLPGSPPQLAAAVAAGGRSAAVAAAHGSPAQQHQVLAAATQSFASGMDEIVVIGAVIVAVGTAAAFGLVRARHFFGSRPSGASAGG